MNRLATDFLSQIKAGGLDRNGFDNRLEVVGTLEKRNLHAYKSGIEGPGHGTAPALSCPVAASKAHCAPALDVPSAIFFEAILFDDAVIMTIKVQLGGTQIVWLADMEDPEVWRAIEMWRDAKAVPIVLAVENGENWNYLTYMVPMCSAKLGIEELLPKIEGLRSSTLWNYMTSQVTRFYLRLQATTGIPGALLEHVIDCPLLTSTTSSYPREEHRKRARVVTPHPMLASVG
ncbi:hypothetical protein [Cupriavidus sp. BIS7]|uniref:hypothetical protein n=1 Tax=Cupriavidus sp. BIS7 TaxID=1217718 RepID=UPI0012F65830|nr:hypothetical protein [Cupriavidus sp. BIS7]